MPGTIKPSDVSAQVDFDINDATDFCADVLEDVNDHQISLALRSVNLGEFELAKSFIDLAAAHQKAGELTPILARIQKKLLEDFKRAGGR